MRVACFGEFGAASVMRVAARPTPPAPRGTQLLVAVHASSVNGTDLGLRRGELKPATWGRMPFVPGFDLAGQVVARGREVTAFAPGDRIAALLPHRGGGQAEYVLVEQHRAARVPDAMTLLDAAAVPLAGLTALQALHRLGRLAAPRSEEETGRVLVIGAAGGIGCFAVQLAVLAGREVTATTTAGKLAWVSQLGATGVLDRRSIDHPALLAQAGPFDVVLDAAGRSRFHDLQPVLAAGGRMVSVRPLHPDAWRGLRPGHRDFAAVRTTARAGDLAHLLHLAATHRLRVPVEHVVPLDDIADAHHLAETRGRGKVVVELVDSDR